MLHAAEKSTPAGKPNVLVILADDQGWGDFSLHGNTNLATPHLDRLACDGARFEHFFVCPLCSPTRAEFLTGRYHPRCGVHGVSTGAERLNLDEKTIADTFHAAGYVFGTFGKWHNGTQYPYHPLARGFDEYYMKDFQPLRLGEIQLDKGRGLLTLRATNIPGKQAMDLWTVVLKLVK